MKTFRLTSLISVLALVLLMLCACTASPPEEPAPPSGADNPAKTEDPAVPPALPVANPEPVGNTDSSDPLPGDAEKEPGTDEKPTTADPAPLSGPFSYEEMLGLFSLGANDIIALYGDPDKKVPVSLFGENSAEDYIYKNGTIFSFELFSQLDKATLYNATVCDDKVPAPRGIRIGDSLETVLAKFPNEGHDERLPLYDEHDSDYVLLYGEYLHMADYGYVKYTAGTASAAVYSNEGTAISYNIANEKVISVGYMIPLT